MSPIVPLEFIFPWAMGLPSWLMPIIIYEQLIQFHLKINQNALGP
jgi:hypothetical protein